MILNEIPLFVPNCPWQRGGGGGDPFFFMQKADIEHQSVSIAAFLCKKNEKSYRKKKSADNDKNLWEFSYKRAEFVHFRGYFFANRMLNEKI